MADSKKNYTAYMQGKEPLRHAILLMDDDDKIHDFVDKSTRRSMWVVPLAKFKEWQEKIKKNEPDNE